MKIFNIMLSRQLGGIEQAFLDYKKMAEIKGVECINIISKNSLIESKLKDAKFELIPNIFLYDIFSRFKIRQLIKRYNPSVIITHGGRATAMANFARIGLSVRLVGLAHNYQHKYLVNCDHAISITEDLKNYLINRGIPNSKISVIANSINITEDYAPLRYNSPVVIGTMGRFVKKKGFDVFLRAIRLLKDRKIEFRVMIGGGGDEEVALRHLCSELDLDGLVNFPGWVNDKSSFFNNIDIFCLPSLHEPFGIVLLEAMMYSKPIVTTNSEGPLEIIKEGKNGVFCEKDNAESMANALERLISDRNYSNNLAKGAYQSVCTNYDINVLANKFYQLLQQVTNNHAV